MLMFVYNHWKLAALENKLPTPTSVTRIYPGSYLNYSLPWGGAKLFRLRVAHMLCHVPQGCILIVKNYPGLRFNHAVAAERARSKGQDLMKLCVARSLLEVLRIHAAGRHCESAVRTPHLPKTSLTHVWPCLQQIPQPSQSRSY